MLTRRQMMAGLGAAALLGPGRAEASGQCAAVDQQTRICQVGLQLGDIQTVRQRCNSWCWAACIQTVFELHGHGVAQESAVEKIFGDPTACEAADDQQIIAAINGPWVDQYGFQFTARAETLPLAWMGLRTAGGISASDPTSMATAMATGLFGSDDLKVMIGELANNNPLIVGRLGAPTGHAMVLTAVTYLESSNGNIALTELIVRDPWPESPNRRTLRPEEVRAVFPVFKVSIEG